MRKADLARLLDVSPSQAANYIDETSNPKIEALILMGEHFDVAIDDLLLVELSKGEGRPFGDGVADVVVDPDEQLLELNKLLRLRVQQVEAALKRLDPGLAGELGIE